MGTRADFYVQRDGSLDWLGSIAWDGYPDGIDEAVLVAKTDAEFRESLTAFFADRDDVTMPDDGWPWPWNDSNTTDYGYVHVEGRGTFYRGFGGNVYAAMGQDDEGERLIAPDIAFEYPDMSDRKNVKFGGKGSGLIVLSA